MLSLLFVVAQLAPLDVEGVWQTANGKAHVEVTVSEDTGPRGVIIWYDEHEKHEADLKAMTPEEREEKRVLGLVLLEGFERGDDAEKWRKGTIFDPTSGKTYRSAIFRQDASVLAVEGCLGLFCRTQEWSLVPENEVVRLAPVTPGTPRR
ncbi:MAG: DUF2147 domain-containing protein [Parvularcula sp.]|nr:DUF2147 domain-containing protein [Parvularcula sp.]